MSLIEQKFDECRKCIYYVKNPPRARCPVCNECGNGEFFEPKISELRPERLHLPYVISERKNVLDE